MPLNIVGFIAVPLVLALLFPFLFADQNDTQIVGSQDGTDLQDEWHQDNVYLWLAVFVSIALLAYGPSLLAIAYVCFARAWHWILFDGSLNLHRGLAWDYVSKARKAAKSDKVLVRIGVHHAKSIKLALALVCTAAYLFLYFTTDHHALWMLESR